MDDCLRYALVSGKKALESAGIGHGSEAFNKLDKQRCAPPLHGPATPPGGAARAIARQAGGMGRRVRKPFLVSPHARAPTTRSCGILCGSGMGGLTVFQNSVQQLLTKARAAGAAHSPLR